MKRAFVCPYKEELKSGKIVCDFGGLSHYPEDRECPTPTFNLCQSDIEIDSDIERNCYTCAYGGDGEEVNDLGHCWLHNGEVDFKQPPKNDGCKEWIPRTAFNSRGGLKI